ncbi:MAG: hypothetical protein R3B98_03615 [Hyphomonas sp.]
MNQTHEPRRAVIAMAFTLLGIVGAMMAFGVAKKTGALEPEAARRGAAAMLGLMLAVIGNFVPKLRLFQPAGGPADSGPVDRFAGWAFVVCGLVFAAVWLFAPADKAMLGSPMIGVAGFLVVLARWLAWRGRHSERLVPRLTPVRMALALLLLSVLWTFGIFFADAVWGDRVSQWMAIGFAIALPMMVPLFVFGMKRT